MEDETYDVDALVLPGVLDALVEPVGLLAALLAAPLLLGPPARGQAAAPLSVQQVQGRAEVLEGNLWRPVNGPAPIRRGLRTGAGRVWVASAGGGLSLPYNDIGGSGGGDGNEDESVWGSAVKWAQAAGEKLSAAESEVWRRINKE